MNLTLHHAHPWDLTPREAIALQRDLAPLVRETPLPHPVRTIAGIDVSIRGDRAQAAIAVLRLPDLHLVDEVLWRAEVPFPYVPGLLSFREIPVILPALERLHVRPDVLMTDSQGRAHPRRFGLACHLGVLLDWPTLGVAKTRLTGRHGPLGPEKGARTPLLAPDADETLGMVLRTRANVHPVYVSVGHRMTLADAVELTLACAPRYKIPEPTRQAHRLSRRTG
ncbi:MAG: endonuclease V [Bacteroidetes bacterium]|nr:MAG: endonuclease V [Bacteroidota bacterium]